MRSGTVCKFGLHIVFYTEEILHVPVSMEEILHVPVSMKEILHVPVSMEEILHVPVSMEACRNYTQNCILVRLSLTLCI